MKKEYDIVILFFDNMIRRNFLETLKNMKACRSGMLCDNIGYNMPDMNDCDLTDADHIELWWIAGTRDYSCKIDFNMFVECLRLSANIWIKNNKIVDRRTIAEIDNSIDAIVLHYIKV